MATTGITGSDGKSPVYDPDRRFTIWRNTEIYFDNGPGEKRYVPNVKDLVVNIDEHSYQYVTAVDPTTLNPTLRDWVPIDSKTLSDIDVLLGPGPSYARDSYRAFLNIAVLPYTMTIDRRLYIHAVNATKAKVFQRNKTTGNDEVVSAYYDSSGNLLGQDIPLELVSMPNSQNFATKTLRSFNCIRKIATGEVLTVIVYDDEDQVCSKSEVMVEQTAAIPTQDTSLKYVVGISLESPFLSDSNPDLLLVPMNILVNNLSLMGVVNYSDGSYIKLPVDGTKFSIAGIQDQGYVATIVGQEFPIVLSYTLSPGEVAYGTSVGENNVFSRLYTGRTEKAEGVYTPKLYAYPIWIDEVSGYRLEWYLYNLDRNLSQRVTEKVKYSSTVGDIFNPTGYGYRQNLTVSVNLNEVNGTFKSMNFVQTIDITLLVPGSDRTTNWTIGFSPNQNPPFGRDNHADFKLINQNLSSVKIALGESDKAAWLNRIYYQTQPLFDSQSEIKAPEPNTFAFIVNGVEQEFPIDQWSSELELAGSLDNNGTLFIKFYKYIDNGRLDLSISGLPIYQTN